MHSIESPQSRRPGQRLVSLARALPAVLTLAALAVPTRSLAQTPAFNAIVTTYTNVGSGFPDNATVGDINGDGKLDAIVTGGDNPTIMHVMLGNGNGTFTDHGVQLPQVTTSNVSNLAPSLTGFLPVSAGAFGAVQAIDVNHDGKLDLVSIETVGINFTNYSFICVMINTGNDANGVPQFTATHHYVPFLGARTLTLGDLNGDGAPDLTLGFGSGAFYIWLNNGSGGFTPGQIYGLTPGAGGPSVGQAVIADLNGDGKADYVVTSNQNHGANVFFGNGDGTLQAPVYLPNFAVSVAVADVNGDGKPDLLMGGSLTTTAGSEGLMVYLNNGGGSFGAPTLYNISSLNGGLAGGGSVAVADINGDGILDAVLSNLSNNTVVVLLGDGHGGFGTPIPFSAQFAPTWVFVGDFNGDGKPDIGVDLRNARNFGVLTNTTVIVLPPVVASASATGSTTAAFSYQISATNSPTSYNATGLPGGLSVNTATGLISGTPTAGGSFTVNLSATNSGGTGTGTLALTITAPVVVFGSGISAVTTWDPIFPTTAYANWPALGTPTQTAGPLPNDPNWVNPHAAFVFPKGTHPWEFIPPMNFDANWINAWNNITSQGPAGQSWTKYSTTVTGQGSFVLQFLADNLSWIYLDGVLVGNQDDHWATNGTGRYTINLSGAGPHELVFIIFDGGGAAGGKFRLETTQSFQSNNPGAPLPPPPDTTPPVITAPSTITQEATSAAGAVVTFTATANDAVSGVVPVTATPPSGSTFAIGISSVSLSATDAAGNTAHAGIVVTVQDTTAPVVTAPANVTAEATSASGAAVTYAAATASDAVGVTSLTYSAASGSTFPLGATTVTVTAKDQAGNTGTGSFTVTVKDTTPPALSAPANVTAEATGASGAMVSYPAATATDAVGVASLTYSQNSGTSFPLGATTVNVTAKDAAGNTSTASFTVTVKDTTPPALTVPANQTIEATSAAGAVATFSASASDAVTASPTITYSAASGSTFPLGTTTVNVTAKDAAGNTSTGSFTITVRDTTPPAITVPANIVAEATSAAGAAVTFNVSATDAVGVTSLTSSAVSGATFPIGTTTVTVTAKDAAGNTGTASFTITVRDTTPPTVTASLVNAKRGGDDESTQTFTIVFAATDAVGVKTLTAVLNGITVTNGQVVKLKLIKSGKQESEKDDGKLQIKATSFLLTVTATDAAGNTGTATAVPVFNKNGKDSEDKKSDDKKDDGKSDNGKKGS